MRCIYGKRFVARVDPIIKILHILMMQATVFTAINNANNVDDDLNALLFAIYFAATTCLSSSGAANLLGQPKSTALNNYKQRLEQSLCRCKHFGHTKL